MGRNKWGNINPPPIGIYSDGLPHPELEMKDEPVEVEIKKRGRKKKNDNA